MFQDENAEWFFRALPKTKVAVELFHIIVKKLYNLKIKGAPGGVIITVDLSEMECFHKGIINSRTVKAAIYELSRIACEKTEPTIDCFDISNVFKSVSFNLTSFDVDINRDVFDHAYILVRTFHNMGEKPLPDRVNISL